MKVPRLIIFLIVIAGLLAGLSACIGQVTPSPTPNPNDIYTQAAQTVAFRITLEAASTAIARLTQLAQIQATQTAATPTPTLTVFVPSATPTATATNTPLPTSTTAPTITPLPTPTPTATPNPLACNLAQFITIVQNQQGNLYQPGQTIVKTWRVKNIGSCAWNTGYALVFVGGEQMGGPSVLNFTANVPPGALVDIAVRLTAPTSSGSYVGFWGLRSDTGVVFGVGSKGDQPLEANVTIPEPNVVAFDLTKNFCDARWRNSTDPLPCPSTELDEQIGFVYWDDRPLIETGGRENEPALITHPNNGVGGMITGEYPAFTVLTGDHFKAVLGCIYQQYNCNVIYQLNYRDDTGRLRKLGQWAVKYDGNLTSIDVDLSNLSGQSIEFVLTVLNNGDAAGDWAFWLFPRVLRSTGANFIPQK